MYTSIVFIEWKRQWISVSWHRYHHVDGVKWKERRRKKRRGKNCQKLDKRERKKAALTMITSTTILSSLRFYLYFSGGRFVACFQRLRFVVFFLQLSFSRSNLACAVPLWPSMCSCLWTTIHSRHIIDSVTVVHCGSSGHRNVLILNRVRKGNTIIEAHTWY